ncbi:hypothetical protein [Vibrio quintilis]|uniref:Alpha/beta hydrolase family protein n=1 Tax=Vibrio quintilis TaxID=1117707 RepID=A0A1M7YS33_9VIBR|nr:hypothetical protein [Vibrio quintilis]SHO55430.1 hypothetical protein VQ7734_01158 [Vibrio quintilis]
MNHDTKHIFILIAGAVEPVCTCTIPGEKQHGEKRPGEAQPAGSSRVAQSYWEDYPQLIRGLRRLCAERSNLLLFDEHGWSGDNTQANREIAGAYLADRLCGSNGKKAHYEEYLNHRVAFHLIGHSHGGNVLNELTKRAASASEWPSHWEIKSIVYLSTPFFKHQHQLNTTRLHQDCAIINVTNDFDLTQRVVADFSMYDLIAAIKSTEQETPGLKEHLKYIQNAPLPSCWSKVKAAFSHCKPLQLLLHPDHYRLHPRDGHSVFQEAMNVLEHTEEALYEIQKIVSQLHACLYYPSDPELLELSPGKSRYLITDQLFEQANELTMHLLRHIIRIKKTLMTYQQRQDYRLIPLLCDLSDSLIQLIDVIAIDKQTTSGPASDFLYTLMLHQIESFDNTRTSPRHQLDYEFAEKLYHVDVTPEDPYFSREHLIRFNQLTKQLIQAEADYEERNSQKNLLKLLLCLVASQSEISPLKKTLSQVTDLLTQSVGSHPHGLRRLISSLACRGKIKPLYQLSVRLLPVLTTYMTLLSESDIRLLAPVEKQKPHNPRHMIPGSLEYFALFSHSVSRQQLWPDIEQLLIPLLPAPAFPVTATQPRQQVVPDLSIEYEQ